jgi:hypothetical protein
MTSSSQVLTQNFNFLDNVVISGLQANCVMSVRTSRAHQIADAPASASQRPRASKVNFHRTLPSPPTKSAGTLTHCSFSLVVRLLVVAANAAAAAVAKSFTGLPANAGVRARDWVSCDHGQYSGRQSFAACQHSK